MKHDVFVSYSQGDADSRLKQWSQAQDVRGISFNQTRVIDLQAAILPQRLVSPGLVRQRYRIGGGETMTAPVLVGGGETTTAPVLVDGGETMTPPVLVDGGETMTAPVLVDGGETMTAPVLVDGGETMTPPVLVDDGEATPEDAELTRKDVDPPELDEPLPDRPVWRRTAINPAVAVMMAASAVIRPGAVWNQLLGVRCSILLS